MAWFKQYRDNYLENSVLFGLFSKRNADVTRMSLVEKFVYAPISKRMSSPIAAVIFKVLKAVFWLPLTLLNDFIVAPFVSMYSTAKPAKVVSLEKVKPKEEVEPTVVNTDDIHMSDNTVDSNIDFQVDSSEADLDVYEEPSDTPDNINEPIVQSMPPLRSIPVLQVNGETISDSESVVQENIVPDQIQVETPVVQAIQAVQEAISDIASASASDSDSDSDDDEFFDAPESFEEDGDNYEEPSPWPVENNAAVDQPLSVITPPPMLFQAAAPAPAPETLAVSHKGTFHTKKRENRGKFDQVNNKKR